MDPNYVTGGKKNDFDSFIIFNFFFYSFCAKTQPAPCVTSVKHLLEPGQNPGRSAAVYRKTNSLLAVDNWSQQSNWSGGGGYRDLIGFTITEAIPSFQMEHSGRRALTVLALICKAIWMY